MNIFRNVLIKIVLTSLILFTPATHALNSDPYLMATLATITTGFGLKTVIFPQTEKPVAIPANRDYVEQDWQIWNRIRIGAIFGIPSVCVLGTLYLYNGVTNQSILGKIGIAAASLVTAASLIFASPLVRMNQENTGLELYTKPFTNLMHLQYAERALGAAVTGIGIYSFYVLWNNRNT